MKLIKLNYSEKLAIAIKGRRNNHTEYTSRLCIDRCDIVNVCSDPILRRLELGDSHETMCYDIILSEYNQLGSYSIMEFDTECQGIKYLSLFLCSYARRNGDKIF